MRLRAFLFFSIAVAMVYFTWVLLKALAANDDPISVWQHVRFGVILTFAITGIPGFLGYVWPLWRLMPESWYRIRDRATALRRARRLGIPAFRRLVFGVFWGHGRNRRWFFDGTRAGLERMDEQTRLAEFGHLAGGVAVLPATIWLAVRGYHLMAVVTVFVNVAFNGYPVLLQRWHRARLMPLLVRTRAGA